MFIYGLGLIELMLYGSWGRKGSFRVLFRVPVVISINLRVPGSHEGYCSYMWLLGSHSACAACF